MEKYVRVKRWLKQWGFLKPDAQVGKLSDASFEGKTRSILLNDVTFCCRRNDKPGCASEFEAVAEGRPTSGKDMTNRQLTFNRCTGEFEDMITGTVVTSVKQLHLHADGSATARILE
jgi:hypothetical protein